jgi:gliding motility-associated-like protein
MGYHSLLGQTDTLCISATTNNYHVIGSTNSTFFWDTQGNGSINAGQGTDSVNITWSAIAGNYQLIVRETSAEGCNGEPQVLQILVLPNLTITRNLTICSSELPYIWNGIEFLQAGSQTVTLPALSGCDSIVTFNLSVIPNVIPSISGDTVVCLNKEISLEATGGEDYLWSTGDSTSIIQISPQQTTTYFVLLKNQACSDTAFYNVIVNPIPDLIISDDTTIARGSSANLLVYGANNYSWSPQENLSCSDCVSPIASPLITTEYCVLGTNSFGCEATACVEVKVEIICDEFFIPNVFAPGNGGSVENECLKLYGTNCIKEMSFKIFNRWGEMVFESNDPRNCWDGQFRGKDQNSGVFVYYLDAQLITNEKINKKGNITLLR